MIKKEREHNVLNMGDFVKASTYKEQAYDLIKEAILYRRLQAEQVYSQDTLCNELGISRTPVREALLELQQEGYVTFLRGRGIMIVPVTSQEARDIIEMRQCIEIEGSRLAASRREECQVEQMTRVLGKMRQGVGTSTPKELYKLDREFHRLIFDASGNKLMFSTIEKLREYFLRFETQTAFDAEKDAMEVCREHQKILEAITSQDTEKAGLAMGDHLYATYERTIKRSDLLNEPKP